MYNWFSLFLSTELCFEFYFKLLIHQIGHVRDCLKYFGVISNIKSILDEFCSMLCSITRFEYVFRLPLLRVTWNFSPLYFFYFLFPITRLKDNWTWTEIFTCFLINKALRELKIFEQALSFTCFVWTCKFFTDLT